MNDYDAERVRVTAYDFLYYSAPAEVVAPELSRVLGYPIDAKDLDLHPSFDVEDLIEGVRIARQLPDGRKDLLNLSGLLMLVAARQAVIEANEDWTDMTTSELVGWHPDAAELERWSASDSLDDEPSELHAETSFGTLGSALSEVFRGLRGSPSS